jgi:hypothetical protein
MNPLDFPCPHCRVEAGVKCRNYLGKGKQPCPDRGYPQQEEPPKPRCEKPKERNLFDDCEQAS